MIEFKENIQEALPYDRGKYIDFLDDDFESSTEWCGVSFQLDSKEKEIGIAKFVENYESLLKNVILKLDNGAFWIINHDDKDLNWFPNDENNLTSLRRLFKQNNVPNTFRGALILMKDDLLRFSKDLISYPFAVFNEEGLLYKNLDISHSELQFIIKISGHWNIDFLTTDKKLLRQVVNENSSSIFSVKQYRGCSLEY
jgi:hypothetical protein